MNSKTQAACKNCNSDVDLLSNEENDSLSDSRIEMKRALRELFLLNHRRRLRQKALATS